MRRNTWWLVGVCLLGVVLAGCATKPISEILAHPEHFRGDDIAIQGRVAASFSVAGLGSAYEVDDGTGRMWVISRHRPAPPEHAHIYVGGRVQTAISFGERTLGIA